MKTFIIDASNDLQLKGLKEPITTHPLNFEDPNNAPPSDTSILSPDRRHSLLFESLPSAAASKSSNIRHVRNRTETFSNSARPFALTDEVTLTQTSSTPGQIQRRPTVSGLEISMNRTSSLVDPNTGGLFGPGLFTSGWDKFTPTNQSPLSGLITGDVSNMQTFAPLSAVDTVVSAIDFLDIVGPTSLHMVEDPFNTFSSSIQSSEVVQAPITQSRMRSYSSAFANPTKPAVPIRHRSISIPEKEMRLDLEAIQSFAQQTFKPTPLETDSSPTRSLWVGNLDSSIPQNDLFTIFCPFGPIDSIRMIPERECAFVNFIKLDDAVKAKSALNGGHIGNCIIKIAYGKADVSVDSIANHASKSLWIGNIPATLEPIDLENIFGRFGPIESARVLSHKNCGFINFVSLEDAAEARKMMNGKEISGATVKIGFAKVPNSTSVTPTVSAQSETGNEWAVDMNFATIHNSVPANGWQRIMNATPVIQSPDTSIYSSSIPGLPHSEHRLDNNLMREFRKRLENASITSDQVAEIFNSTIHDAAAVSADYIGNVVIQKLVEKGTDDQLFQIIQKISPYIAAIGIHKNGTWAVQKILDTIQLPQHIGAIVQAIAPYTPALLLDQYGNYVVQCCLRFGCNQNQFIFHAISTNILKVGLARFGARATRTCLESPFTSKAQQKLVTCSIIEHCNELSCDQNGALLMSWLMDSCTAPGKYAELVPVFKQNLVNACTHKIASAFILKICVQKSEPEARESILADIFSKNLVLILSDPVNGTSLIRKILMNSATDLSRLAAQISKLITKADIQKFASIKRFMEEFSITVNFDNVSR